MEENLIKDQFWALEIWFWVCQKLIRSVSREESYFAKIYIPERGMSSFVGICNARVVGQSTDRYEVAESI